MGHKLRLALLIFIAALITLAGWSGARDARRTEGASSYAIPVPEVMRHELQFSRGFS